MILITRDPEKSNILARKLQEKGLKTMISPLFEVLTSQISPNQEEFFKNNQINSLIISSSNVIDYLTNMKLPKDIQIFAIGQRTAQNLQEFGYKNIKYAQNSANSLLELVKNNSRKEDQIIYLSGEIITIDLAQELEKAGFKAKKIIAYKIKEEKSLSDEVILAIKNKKIKQVTIYSQNTLNIFQKLILKHNLLEYCNELELLCLSDELVKFAKKAGFTKSQNINIIWK